MKWLVAAFLVVLSGCATIDWDRPPPADFPQLTITEFNHLKGCDSSILFPVLGCAYISFPRNTCDVYLLPNSPEWLVVHEYAHCFGWEHPESTQIRDWWDNHKRNITQGN